MVNLRPRIIASAAGIPIVNVSVDRRRVPLGTQVTFSLTPAEIVSNPKYQVTLYFGDRDQQVLHTSVIEHFYQAAGTYTYSIVVKATGTSDPDPAPKVALEVTPSRVEERRQVKFSAQLSHRAPNVQYRFDYGDGLFSGWQSTAQSTHEYQKAGRYLPFVEIRDGNKPLGGSPRKAVAVTKTPPPPPLSVYLTANPLPAQSRQLVTFDALVSPSGANTRYLFAFGDGSQPRGWQSSSRTTHRYSQPGSYPAYVQVAQLIGGANLSATSGPVSVYVQRPTPTPSPRPSPQPSPTPTPNASPAPSPPPGASPSPTASTSPTPFGSVSPTPDGSPSPGPTAAPNPSDSPIVGNTSPSPTASSSSSGPNGPAGPIGLPNDWWKYLLILALILFLVYQATALLFAAQPVFTPFSDPGVAGIADTKGTLPINFQWVLNPNVTAGDYLVKTDAPKLVTNAGVLDDREMLEI